MRKQALARGITVYAGDCIDVLPTLSANSIDAIVTDPPYGLGFMGKDWDSPGGLGDFPMRRIHSTNMVNTGVTRQGGRQRSCEDFTKRQIRDARAFGEWCEQWAREAFRVLKPGGHIVAFGGTRTYHRMACAIEDAGFEIRDQIGWMYGQGFPKSHDVSKAIDRQAGARRKVVERVRAKGGGTEYINRTNAGTHGYRPNGYQKGENILDITAPATAAARAWAGFGTALKPAFEPIILARKPLIGTVAKNVLAYGTGGINIDGCRVATNEDLNGGAYTGSQRHDGTTNWRFRNGGARGRDGEASAERRYTKNGSTNFAATPGPRGGSPGGRWPANLVHDGSDEVLKGFPESKSSGGSGPASKNWRGDNHTVGANLAGATGGFGDSGSAARFFYCAKASKRDRLGSKHPTVKPIALMRWLVRLVTPPGGIVLDPFAGTGTTGQAALQEGFRAILIEREREYQADIRRRIANDRRRKPKVKARRSVRRPAPPQASTSAQLRIAACRR